MNNCVENLVYGSAKENGQDKVRHGRSTKGIKNVKAKLSEGQAKYIYLAQGIIEADELSVILGISKTTIYRIWNGKRWSHVTGASNRALEKAAL